MQQTSKAVGLLIAILCLVLCVGCGKDPQSLLTAGNRSFNSGRFDEAEIQYRRALQISPQLGEAHYRLGLTELTRNRLAEAWQELQLASDLMPDNADVTAHTGELALTLYNESPQHPQQLYSRAAEAANRLLAGNEDDFDGNLLKGSLALVDKNPTEAISSMRRALRAKPGDRGAEIGLANALTADHQSLAAIELARQWIQDDKTFDQAYDFLFATYQSAGKTEEAAGILKLRVSNNPGKAALVLDLARYYAAIQKPEDVAGTLRVLAENPSVYPTGRMIAGDFYTSAGRPTEAMVYYKEGLDANPANPISWQKKIAQTLLAQQQWPEALAQVNVILKTRPDDSEAKLLRARIWIQEGRPENLDPAIAELRAHLSGSKQDFGLHFELGNAFARKGDLDGARQQWTIATQENKSYLRPQISRVRLDLMRGETTASIRAAQQIVDSAPRSLEARLLLVTCLTRAGRYDRAHEELNQLNRELPNSPQVQFTSGVLAIAENKFATAEAIFHNMETSAGGDPRVLAGLAEALEGENETGKAIELLRDHVNRNPGSAAVRQILAQLAFSSKKYDVALEQYKELTVLRPGSAQIQRALAASYIAAGNPKAAVGILERAVRDQPKSATFSIDYARTLVAVNRTDDAKKIYRRVLETDPDNPDALNDLAYLMADSSENLDLALSLAKRGQQHAIDPVMKASLYDTLGWIYLKKNMADAALQTFQILVKNSPANPTYLYHLGAAFYQKGDVRNARAQLQSALAAKPKSTDEMRIRRLLAGL